MSRISCTFQRIFLFPSQVSPAYSSESKEFLRFCIKCIQNVIFQAPVKILVLAL